MSSEKDNILEPNQYMKLDKMSYMNYSSIESLIEKLSGCANNAENSSTTKIRELIPCEYSMLKIQAFDHIENKHKSFVCNSFVNL